MKLIDVTVPLDASLPNYPGNQPFVLDNIAGAASLIGTSVVTIGAPSYSYGWRAGISAC